MRKKRYILKFPPQSGDKPLSYHLVRDYDIRINILKAEVRPGKTGSLVLELEGTKENLKLGIQYLEDNQVSCEPLDKKIHWKQERCINCGNCTAVCFTGALVMDPKNWELKFDPDKCIVCELCVPACPLNLFAIDFRE
ncbi:MAG: methionine ABC transporter [Bacteroidetes bacterium GWF2_42_66]|nr:MAG: methionine ABC transporter [Bacteroidetes bacterium GWE2_42_39]OFY42786.1 MAG: methionine ABC transporter [Bacteroidetes bacterium GWF2_42_66]HBL74404.1 methionine ABC transporter [Prolixibacteraceae bacterium]HCR91379.1 methionine ABC transporter [Prolixibacteraceae bacterium]HCU61886.1 methionine ABC transporter [Prolixibacteraceae bacterium]